MAAKPDQRVRIAAARLRLTTDAKQGIETPEWVKDLADNEAQVGDRLSKSRSVQDSP